MSINSYNAGTVPTFSGMNVTSNFGNVCPFMISPLSQANATAASTSTNSYGIDPAVSLTGLNCNLSIASYTFNNITYRNPIQTGCRLYTCSYTLSPQNEERYLNALPTKRIMYEDFNFYSQNMTAITPGSTVNPFLSQGLSRVRGILLIPQIAATVHGSTFAGLTSGTYAAGSPLGSPLLSPFSTAPGSCCPFARLSNLNVFLAGSTIYQQNITYGYEQYCFEMRKRGVYSNQIRGISSGLISPQDWELNYGFIYIDLSEHIGSEAEDNALKSLQLQFTNACNVTLDIYAFVFSQRQIDISTSTGQLII
jgi:hypothetical protein